jgi:hypothetical protein
LFCAWLNVVAGADVVRAPQLVGRSHTLSPPLVFDVCVFCLCADMLACAGTVLQRSPVAPETRQAACESPIAVKRVGFYFSAAFKGVVGDEGCMATVGGWTSHCWLLCCVRLSVDVSTEVCVCLCACMLACAGAVPPRSAVAPETRQAACESHCGEACWLLFCAAFKVLVCDEGSIATLLAFVLRRVG